MPCDLYLHQRIFGPTGASVRLPVLIGVPRGRKAPSFGRIDQLPDSLAGLRSLLTAEMSARIAFPSI